MTYSRQMRHRKRAESPTLTGRVVQRVTLGPLMIGDEQERTDAVAASKLAVAAAQDSADATVALAREVEEAHAVAEKWRNVAARLAAALSGHGEGEAALTRYRELCRLDQPWLDQ